MDIIGHVARRTTSLIKKGACPSFKRTCPALKGGEGA